MDFDLTDTDKLAYFRKNLFTLDGLWMVVAEEHLGAGLHPVLLAFA